MAEPLGLGQSLALREGVEKLAEGLLAERSDAPKGAILRAWLDGSVIPTFSDRVMAVDHRIVVLAAALHVPDPAPFRDALIGGHRSRPRQGRRHPQRAGL